MRKVLIALAVVIAAQTSTAQIQVSEKEYADLKAAGALTSEHFTSRPPSGSISKYTKKADDRGEPKSGGGANCSCYIPPDNTYTQITNWPLGPLPLDDQSIGPIPLPFTYNLYGDTYNEVYININGNVSFGGPISTFTATSFPVNGDVMVAPFWGDVDLNGAGEVYFKVSSTAMYINWEAVGYYGSNFDKLNTFQLIITDGTDPIIGVGNNAGFCYEDMQWTTGDASGGINGFGGTPATVGANKGDGIDFVQFGTFDAPGNAYDGPFGNADGIDWLDDQSFVLNTAVSGSNVAPVASGLSVCDTLTMCVGEVLEIPITFLSPEQSQITTATSSAPSLSNYSEISNVPGIDAVIVGQVIAQAADVGFHTISFSATDNGTPPLTAFIDVVVEVLPAPSSPPVITGDSLICIGQAVTLGASTGFDTYEWSNGTFGDSITVGNGTYTVTGAIGSCFLVSDPFTVTESGPSPVIDGILFACGNDPTELSTLESYSAYEWSNGSMDPSIVVGSGTYSVTVTDSIGCESTSASVTVNISPDPLAGYSANPPSPSLPGTTVDFTDLSSVSSGSIVDWNWDFGNGIGSNDQNPSVLYADPGNYSVTLTVTTADGCSHTITLVYIIQPVEVFVPNVFTPNNDGENQYFEVVGLEGYPGSSLTVYSRWGNVVYESSNYKNNWDARDVSEGTYYYILGLRGGEEKAGTVSILR